MRRRFSTYAIAAEQLDPIPDAHVCKTAAATACFTLSPLDLRGIGATAALEVKVLTNCVVKQAH